MEYKNELMKGKCIMKNVSKKTIKASNGITLIALVITVIVNRVFYDKNIKLSNLVGSSL